jgi:hypothetical protein
MLPPFSFYNPKFTIHGNFEYTLAPYKYGFATHSAESVIIMKKNTSCVFLIHARRQLNCLSLRTAQFHPWNCYRLSGLCVRRQNTTLLSVDE